MNRHRITFNLDTLLGLCVLSVIVGALILAWFGKEIPESALTLGGVALGFLGRSIIESDRPGVTGEA